MSTYPPLARAHDAVSSHAAAERAVQSGLVASQEAQTLDALREHAGCLGVTSKRLSQLTGLDRHMLARRLPGLRDKNMVIEDRSNGREIRWMPKAKQGELW